MLLGVLLTLASIQSEPPPNPMMTEIPRSIGRNKNIYEMRTEPPAHSFNSTITPELEHCLTLALSFGLGGAPVVTHQPQETFIASLLPNTYGLVSSMIVIKPEGVVEYRGRAEFELRLVRQCFGLPARQSSNR